MPEFARDKETGEYFVFDQNRGDWRPATRTDMELSQNPVQSGILSAAQGLTGVPGLLSPETGQAIQNQNPVGIGALEVGSLAVGGLGVAGLGLSALRRKGTGNMSQRVAEQIQTPPMSAAPINPQVQAAAEQVDLLADGLKNFGGDSAGAASRGGWWEAFKAVPGLKATMEGLEEFIGASRRLEPDQIRLLESGNAERLGFSWLPGQRNGNNIMPDIMRSQPFMADALDPVLSANADQLGAWVMQAVKLKGREFGRDVLTDGPAAVSKMFEEVASKIPGITLGDDIVKTLDNFVLTADEKLAYGIKETAGEAGEKAAERVLRVEGREAMEVRKLIQTEMANRARNKGKDKVYRQMSQAMDKLDTIVDDALEAAGDTTTRAKWVEAKQRWRVVRALDSRGVVNQDGSISLKGLANALAKEFDDEFNASLFAPDNVTEDVRNLMDYTRLARAFESNLGDSGTATRSALGDLINSPSRWAKQRLASRFVSDVLLDNPQRAADLPQ